MASSFRARKLRDFIVPSGTPVTSPASAGVRPQTSHRSAAVAELLGQPVQRAREQLALPAAGERIARIGRLGE